MSGQEFESGQTHEVRVRCVCHNLLYNYPCTGFFKRFFLLWFVHRSVANKMLGSYTKFQAQLEIH